MLPTDVIPQGNFKPNHEVPISVVHTADMVLDKRSLGVISCYMH